MVAACQDCDARSGEVRTQITGSGANTQATAEAKRHALAAWNERAPCSHPDSAEMLRLADALKRPTRWHDLTDAELDDTAALLRRMAGDK